MQTPPDLGEDFHKTIRKLAPGPGNWITPADATHLKSAFSFPCAFKDPTWTSLAAKLRITATIAQDCYSKKRELGDMLITYGRRPFPKWHSKCYFCVLARAGEFLIGRGIHVAQVNASRDNSNGESFQGAAERLIRNKLQKHCFVESRIRQKLVPWKLKGPAHLEEKVLRNFRLLSQWAPPRVMSVYLRSIWGGWVTDERMKSLLKTQGTARRHYVLNCGWDEFPLSLRSLQCILAFCVTPVGHGPWYSIVMPLR